MWGHVVTQSYFLRGAAKLSLKIAALFYVLTNNGEGSSVRKAAIRCCHLYFCLETPQGAQTGI